MNAASGISYELMKIITEESTFGNISGNDPVSLGNSVPQTNQGSTAQLNP